MFSQVLYATLKVVFNSTFGGGGGRWKLVAFSNTADTLFGGKRKNNRSYKNHACKINVSQIPQIKEV